MDNIPEQCKACLNLTELLDCKALSTLQTEDCFARTTNPAEMVKRLRAIDLYTRKHDILVPAELRGEIEKASRAVDRISTRDIHQVMYEDMRRGKGGGGGEKEKAPNKKRPKKNIVWSWEES